jgi:hypothetical protein
MPRKNKRKKDYTRRLSNKPVPKIDKELYEELYEEPQNSRGQTLQPPRTGGFFYEYTKYVN